MNNPEYILTDEMRTIVAAVKTALALPVLNYQHGYVTELDETLKQYEADPSLYNQKYPLIWFAEPFTEIRASWKYWSDVKDMRLFILHATEKTTKAADRMTDVFKVTLLPIYRELISQIDKSKVFVNQPQVLHSKTNRYYWGEKQQSVLTDPVDCIEVSQLQLKVKNNPNCP
jgi:hypothetical protein